MLRLLKTEPITCLAAYKVNKRPARVIIKFSSKIGLVYIDLILTGAELVCR